MNNKFAHQSCQRLGWIRRFQFSTISQQGQGKSSEFTISKIGQATRQHVAWDQLQSWEGRHCCPPGIWSSMFCDDIRHDFRDVSSQSLVELYKWSCYSLKHRYWFETWTYSSNKWWCVRNYHATFAFFWRLVKFLKIRGTSFFVIFGA